MQNFIPVQDENQPVSPVQNSSRKRSSHLLVLVLIVVALVGGFLFRDNIPFLSANISDTVLPKSNTYQAVFLIGGPVYFGKLEIEDKWLKLTDVYYLQAENGDLQQGVENLNSVQLVKLGSEVHGPEDSMYINKENVLFWEDLKKDSGIIQTIEASQN